MHDDIMDNAPMRRGKQTVHEKWNTNVAILSGDAMYTVAFDLMMQVDNDLVKPVLKLFNNTALEVCEGQQMDMDFEKHSSIKIEEYLQMISLKTAVLLACALKTGALIARTSNENAEHIYGFGKNLGIAFQLQDDILDVFGDKSKVGKQVGGDIVANKKTFLLLKAMQSANIDQYDLLMNLLKNKNNRYEPWEKVQKVTELYLQLGVKEMAEQEVNSFYQKALQHLSKIELPDENKKVLYEFGAQLMQREL
jgi:geranylgeranyl diphosphate synthase, type II